MDGAEAGLLEVCVCGEVVVAGPLLVAWSEGEVPRFASGRMSRYAFIASAGMARNHSFVSSFQAAYRRIGYTGGKSSRIPIFGWCSAAEAKERT